MAAAALFFLGSCLSVPASVPGASVWNVYEIMDEVNRLSGLPLWPGFDPRLVPAAIYDGRDTYLFDFPSVPKGFAPAAGHPGALIYSGQHVAVLGNRGCRIDGVWTASSIPQDFAPGTDRPFSITDNAAIIIHEKFHIFQVNAHPDWRPNDLILLTCPLDTADSLAARRLELEAFRRALTAESADDAASWAKAGLALRMRRLAGLREPQADYEREIQRLEGIAEYIEFRASGRSGSDGPLVDEFAPRGIRLMGYLEGRWLAVLLDRFDPSWKNRLESGDHAYLEDLLAEALALRSDPREFTDADRAAVRRTAERDVLAKTAERKREERNFFAKLGYRIDILAGPKPFRFETFDPFSIEALAERKILHRTWVIGRNEAGIVEVWLQPCVTELDPQGHILRLILTGVRRKPPLKFGYTMPLGLVHEGLTVILSKARLRIQGDLITIRLEM